MGPNVPTAGSRSDLAGRVRSSAIWTVVGRISSTVAVFAVHMILARALSLAEYGAFVTVLAIAAILGRICPFGMNSLAIRESRAHENSNDAVLFRRIIWLSIGTSLIACSLYALGNFMGSNLPGKGYAGHVIVWSLAIACSNLTADMLRAHDEYAWANFLGGQIGGFGTNIFQLVALLFAWNAGFLTRDTAILIFIGSSLFTACLGVWKVSSQLRRPKGTTQHETLDLWRLFREAIPILVVELFVLGHPHIEALIIDASVGSESVGIFSSVRRVIQLAGFPLLLLNTTIRPFLAQLYRQQKSQELDWLMRGSATIAFLIALPIYIGAAVFARPILTHLFRSEFAEGALALQILTISGLVFVATGGCAILLLMTGNQKITMRATIVYYSLYLIAGPIIIKQYGIVGAACCGAVLVASVNITLLIASRRVTGMWTSISLDPKLLRGAWSSFIRREVNS